jgi:hypothetical protein
MVELCAAKKRERPKAGTQPGIVWDPAAASLYGKGVFFAKTRPSFPSVRSGKDQLMTVYCQYVKFGTFSWPAGGGVQVKGNSIILNSCINSGKSIGASQIKIYKFTGNNETPVDM